jgi:galactokinase/mevalonate kinase-like predicted kinase
MPQEVSVSYQAIKSKVYRLIDALVVGEKNEAEVQESVRRWWTLIHPADRRIAQKYLQMVLERSSSALGAMEDALVTAGGPEPVNSPQIAEKRLVERMVKESSVRPAV